MLRRACSRTSGDFGDVGDVEAGGCVATQRTTQALQRLTPLYDGTFLTQGNVPNVPA